MCRLAGTASHVSTTDLQQVRGQQAGQQHSQMDGSRHHCPLHWLQTCRGFAPKHTAEQQQGLRQALAAARYVLGDCFSRLWDSRAGVDLVPWMLQVRLDFKQLLCCRHRICSRGKHTSSS